MYKRQDSRFKAKLARKRDRQRATEACHAATLRFPGLTEEDINSGSCFDWATEVFDLIEGSRIAGHNLNGVGHCYIYYRGYYYDAEVPQGIRNWLALPFWTRLKAKVGAKEFNGALRKVL